MVSASAPACRFLPGMLSPTSLNDRLLHKSVRKINLISPKLPLVGHSFMPKAETTSDPKGECYVTAKGYLVLI